MREFHLSFHARWADMDPNRHMRHTAYNDYAAQVRVALFSELGIPIEEIARRGLGPVLFREDTRFLREVRLMDGIRVSCAAQAMRRDGTRFSLRHDVHREDEIHAARIVVDGAWLDLERRRLGTPFPELLGVMERFPRTDDFAWLEGDGDREKD